MPRRARGARAAAHRLERWAQQLLRALPTRARLAPSARGARARRIGSGAGKGAARSRSGFDIQLAAAAVHTSLILAFERSDFTIPAVDVGGDAVVPKGSTWRRDPIPACACDSGLNCSHGGGSGTPDQRRETQVLRDPAGIRVG